MAQIWALQAHLGQGGSACSLRQRLL
jgi:hypothetical protein